MLIFHGLFEDFIVFFVYFVKNSNVIIVMWYFVIVILDRFFNINQASCWYGVNIRIRRL